MKQTIVLTEFFGPHHGGIEDSLFHLVPLLEAVVVVTPPVAGSEDFDRQQSYQVIRRSLFSGRLRPRWLWLVSWLWSRRRATTQVLYGHFSMAVAAAWLLRPAGVRYLIFVHGNDLLSEVRGWRRWLIPHFLRGADWIGVNSDFTRDLIHRFGVPLVKVVKLYPMVPDDLLDVMATPTNPAQLITVTRLVPRKNIALVLETVAKLRSEFPTIEYHLVGDGPERHILEQHVVTLGLENCVTFHGHVSEAEKRQLLRSATIAVMTPLASGANVEGLGLFYLEASAVGLPVVTSASGGVGEAVVNGKTGIVLPDASVNTLRQAIADLLNNPAMRQTFGQAGRQHVAHEFTASLRTARFQQVLRRQHQPTPPLVSVIIPVWQDADTIGQTLNDLRKQTWLNYEIIVVDDGSTDALEAALVPFRKNIQFYRQANQGAPVARNLGASHARGEFLLFVDADARLNQDLITTMVVALQTHPESAYAYSSFRFGPKSFRLFEFSASRLRQMNYIHTTSLLRRSTFPGFDPGLKKFQDWDLWLTMLAQGHTGLWIPRQLFSLQQRANKISSWLPSLVYKLPGIGQGRGSQTIARYRQAEARIRKKHRL